MEAKKVAFYSHWIEQKKGGKFVEIECFRGTRASWPLIEAARIAVSIAGLCVLTVSRLLATGRCRVGWDSRDNWNVSSGIGDYRLAGDFAAAR